MVESKKESTLPIEVLQAKQLIISVADYTVMSGTVEIISNLDPLCEALISGGI